MAREVGNKVAVVGAGIAGTAAAHTMKSLEEELDVTVFERRSKVGKTICGNITSNRALEKHKEFLFPLPKECVAREVDTTLKKLWDEPPTIVPDTFGKVLYRQEFNRHLIKKINDIGCNIKMSCPVVDVKIKRPFMRAPSVDVTYFDNRQGVKFTEPYDMVITADGGESQVALWAGLLNKEERKEWLKSRRFGYQWYIRFPKEFDELKFDFTPKPNKKFKYHYAWFYYTSDKGNVYIVGNVSESDVDQAERKSALQAFIKREFGDDWEYLRAFTGYIPYERLPRIYDDCLIVVGDAKGAARNPYSSGINAALSDGRMAGEAVVEAYRAGDFSKGMLEKTYRIEWERSVFSSPEFDEFDPAWEMRRGGYELPTEKKKVVVDVFEKVRNEIW